MVASKVGRRGMLAGLATSVMLVSAGCGSSAPVSTPKASGPVSLTYWSGHASGALYKAVVAEVAQFNKTHPSIRVKFIPRGASSHGLAAFEAGQAPSVGMVSAYIVPQLARAGALVPLTKYVNGPNGLTAAQIHQDYYPAVWNDMREGSSVQYQMPLEKKATLVIYYNTALFKKAGITTLPKTWAQVGADAAKISSLGSSYHGIAWTPYLDQLYDITLSNGGQVFTSATNRRAFALDNPAAIATMNMFKGWIKSGAMIMTSGYEYQLDFGTGKVGMVIDSSAGYTYDKRAIGGKFVMAGISAPAGTSGHSSQYINGASLVMFNVGTAAQKAAAWTFMKWMSSPSTNVYWDEHTNYLPLGPAAYSMMKSFYAQHPAQAGSYSDPAYWWFKPRTANYEASVTPMTNYFIKGLTGGMSVTAALKAMDTTGSAYLSGKIRG